MVSSTLNFKDNENFARQEDHAVTAPNLASRHFRAANEPAPWQVVCRSRSIITQHSAPSDSWKLWKGLYLVC